MTFVGTSGADQTHNTLVLDGIELVIPLEVDLDTDPKTPDRVRLKSDDGSYESELTAGQPGVEQDGDNPLNYFHFQFVPVGVFSVAVRIGDNWSTVLRSLRVTHDGVFVGNVNFEADTNGSELGTPQEYQVEDLPDEEADDHVCGA